MGRNTHQHAVAIVQPGMHQGNYQLLECGGTYILADLTQLTKSGKATRRRFLDMHPHGQVSVYVDAEMDGLHWSDVDAVNQHSSGCAEEQCLQCSATCIVAPPTLRPHYLAAATGWCLGAGALYSDPPATYVYIK